MLARPSHGPVSSPYGPRKLTGSTPTMHSGIDFVGALGSPIRAVKDGTVYVAAPNGTYNKYGNVVVIRHDDASEAPYSLYAHLNSIAVRKGQRVKAGQVVGTMGNTAATKTNPSNKVRTHLHFELLRRFPAPPDVDRVNPTPYLPGMSSRVSPAPAPVPAPSPMYTQGEGPLLYPGYGLGEEKSDGGGLLAFGFLFSLYVVAHVLAARNAGEI